MTHIVSNDQQCQHATTESQVEGIQRPMIARERKEKGERWAVMGIRPLLRMYSCRDEGIHGAACWRKRTAERERYERSRPCDPKVKSAPCDRRVMDLKPAK